MSQTDTGKYTCPPIAADQAYETSYIKFYTAAPFQLYDKTSYTDPR